jgi:hypothetical protein
MIAHQAVRSILRRAPRVFGEFNNLLLVPLWGREKKDTDGERGYAAEGNPISRQLVTVGTVLDQAK